jgi:uncharacterized membrane protein
VYGLIGVILIVAGVLLIRESLNNLTSLDSLFSGFFAMSNLGGFVLIGIGCIIIALGAVASFFKINSEIIAEEVPSQKQNPLPKMPEPATYCCKTCGATVSSSQKYCSDCGRQLEWH